MSHRTNVKRIVEGLPEKISMFGFFKTPPPTAPPLKQGRNKLSRDRLMEVVLRL